MSAIGTPFERPKIKTTAVTFGGWTKVEENNEYIASGTEMALNYLKGIGENIPDNVNVEIHEAAVQVVSGVNIYLELKIISQNIYIKIQIYDPINNHKSNTDAMKILRIFSTKNKLW